MTNLYKENRPDAKRRVAAYIAKNGPVSKGQLSSALGLSMPTVLKSIKALSEAGLVAETGKLDSTGGRPAGSLEISDTARCAAGLDIRKEGVTFVLMDLKFQVRSERHICFPFSDTEDYRRQLCVFFDAFLNSGHQDRPHLLGIGLSLPGIVDKEARRLCYSHTLNARNISFVSPFLKFLVPIALENDANSAARAEFFAREAQGGADSFPSAVYLSLSSTVGGALYFNGGLYEGENQKSGEFGHMVIEKNGRPCYCGKRGCMDAYCSTKRFEQAAGGSLETFFEKVRKGDQNCRLVLDQYLDDLALSVSNLRMAFDCPIILGGQAGEYLEEFLRELKEKVQKYNNFDSDASYLKTGLFRRDASACGAALIFLEDFYRSL